MDNKKDKRRIELLAPVGGIEHLRAAVQAGADAVYLGGKLFNARIKAGNLDDEEMRYAVDYAHLRGVRVNVTMNTLLKDEELPEALSYAAKLYEMGVDALIIQDLGLASLIHKAMPDFPIHLSTQGTVYDVAGVSAAAKLGFERVVLARELTLPEIEACCNVVGPEGKKTEI
ncbi:MAG: U32 family peptidase, partial [Firmicutes bacterium]|nr:U32 family peptidase [Bacillota bacterium]